MPKIRWFALVMGIAFLVVGGMGFIPGLLRGADGPHHERGVVVHAFEGYLLGLFHVNILHSAVHLLFGVLGVIAAGSFGLSRWYARFVAVSYAGLAVMGLIPGLDTMYGLIPLHGHDVWLHAVIAAAAAYYGFVLREVEYPNAAAPASNMTVTPTP